MCIVTTARPARLAEDGDVDLRIELSALLCTFTAKRQISCEHVAMWTSVTIAEDWAGYCAAAKLIWAMMEDQIDKERRYLGARLRQSAPGSDRQTKKGPA